MSIPGDTGRGYSEYKEVPAEHVRQPIQRAAMQALTPVRRDLELGPVHLRWFKLDRDTKCDFATVIAVSLEDPALGYLLAPSFDPGLYGKATVAATPPVIWVRTSLTPPMAAVTVAHEARHLWQEAHWSDQEHPPEECEEDAQAYMWRAPLPRRRLIAAVRQHFATAPHGMT